MKWFYVIVTGILAARPLVGSELGDDHFSKPSSTGANFNAQLHPTDGDTQRERRLGGSTEPNNVAQAEDGSANEKTNELRKPFDIDRFLIELDAFDCDKRKGNKNVEQETESGFDPVCAERLSESMLNPLGSFDTNSDEVYGYLADNIYSPLAYDVAKKDSLSELLKDLIFLDNRKAMIAGNAQDDSLSNFSEKTLEQFSRISGLTSDMDKNHENISNISTDLLKNFHVYWNTLRARDEVGRVKEDTKQIMRNILKEYEVKEQFLFEVTQTLVQRLKESYTKFMTAHQSVKLLNLDGPKIIADRIMKRYNNILGIFKTRNYSYIQFVREMMILTDLQQAYYVISYKMKYSEPTIIHNYMTDVFNKFEPLYLDFVKTNSENETATRLSKDFTAAVMLKMKHMQYIIFNFHGIAIFVNFDRSVVQMLSNVSVKVYYDFFNSLMLVPKSCLNILVLKECAFNEVNKSLRNVGFSYLLKRSTAGWQIYSYLSDMLKMLFQKSNDTVFSNWTLFKAYYYQNLFSIMTNLKQRFMIKDIECVDDLEQSIGAAIDNFKQENGGKYLNFGLVDELDNQLYKVFLTIKAEFNKYDNINRDPGLLMRIQNEVFTHLKGFEKKYSTEINQDFFDLMDKVKSTVEDWRASTVNAPEVSIQVSQLPLHTMNMYPQIFHNVVGQDAKHNFNTLHQYPEDAEGSSIERSPNADGKEALTGRTNMSSLNDINEGGMKASQEYGKTYFNDNSGRPQLATPLPYLNQAPRNEELSDGLRRTKSIRESRELALNLGASQRTHGPVYSITSRFNLLHFNPKTGTDQNSSSVGLPSDAEEPGFDTGVEGDGLMPKL